MRGSWSRKISKIPYLGALAEGGIKGSSKHKNKAERENQAEMAQKKAKATNRGQRAEANIRGNASLMIGLANDVVPKNLTDDEKAVFGLIEEEGVNAMIESMARGGKINTFTNDKKEKYWKRCMKKQTQLVSLSQVVWMV
jgi:hypothetical protein